MPELWILRNFNYVAQKTLSEYKGSDEVFQAYPIFFPGCFNKHPATHAGATFGRMDVPSALPQETDGILSALPSAPGHSHHSGLSWRQLVGLENQPVVLNGPYVKPIIRKPLRLQFSPLNCAVRGKELVFINGDTIILIHFKTQGHVVVVPTSDALKITAPGPVDFTAKGMTFELPSSVNGCNVDTHIRIMMAFIGKHRSFLFVDHQGFMTIRVARLPSNLSSHDLHPGSSIWPHLWGSDKGGDWILERPLAKSGFERFIDRYKNSPLAIHEAIHRSQFAFNGFGRWMISDLLHLACLHPMQPSYSVMAFPENLSRLASKVIEMAEMYNPMASDSPGTLRWHTAVESSAGPYAFNEYGFRSWKGAVLVYRNREVTLKDDKKFKRGLLAEQLTLVGNGTAEYKGIPGEDTPSAPFRDIRKESAQQQAVYHWGGDAFTCICAATPDEWCIPKGEAVRDNEDFSSLAFRNKPTLGPYSFQLFHTLRQGLKELEVRRGAPPKMRTGKVGRPAKSKTHAKAQKVHHIGSKAHKRLERAQKEDIAPEVTGRVLRSSTKRTSSMVDEEISGAGVGSRKKRKILAS
ncbi:hypothetical protein BD410DRAFT_900354 [Rickenella mellea]|uniref:Uncharacterized protein n=1 Tax=Rickenella mellea TaxID=50990 RepID=A0A4Y7PWC5_9AGAM|nr:hypothetical protein BD410DRAFT_900354 [Rickenella mellea]